MKPIAIVPALVLLLVAGVYFFRDKGAREELLVARAELGGMSNRLAETRSNVSTQDLAIRILQTNLALKSEQFTNATTRLDRAMAMLKQHETHITGLHAKLAEADQRLAASQGEGSAMTHKVEELTNRLKTRDQDLSQLKEKLTAEESEGKLLAERFQKMQLQNMELLLQLNDPVLLWQQISKLRKQYFDVLNSDPGAAGAPAVQTDTAESKGGQQIATRSHRPGGKGKLELQPDGSVRLVPPN